MALKTRKPTGIVPWPLILVEGGEKSGKSWAAAVLSSSARVGRTFWFDLAEGAGDEYGAIPGVRYEIVEHDGTWQSIIRSVEEIRDEAARAAAAKEPPVVLVIDSMTAEWDLLKDWASNRAKARLEKKGRRVDADADVQISMDLWNDANGRHRKLMTILMTFPGIAVITARGKEVAALDASGRPVEGSKEYKVEGQKGLAFDATVWLRLSRTEHPSIVGARSVHAGVVPGEDKPLRKPGLTLESLVFDVLRCNPAQAHTRDLVELKPGSDSPDEMSPRALALSFAIDEAPDQATLRTLWAAIAAALKADEIVKAEADQLANAITARKADMDAAGTPAEPAPPAETVPMVRQDQHRHMHALWRDLQLDGEKHRERRLERTAEILGLDEPLDSSAHLTAEQADKVIRVLDEELKEARDVAPDMAGATT
jgi:hypothetical protein